MVLYKDIPLVPAKHAGRTRNLTAIDTVVIHRLARGSGDAGLRYIQDPGDGRVVSWHLTLHNDKFSRPYTKHLKLSQVAWHCGQPTKGVDPRWPQGVNATSIGIELDGPMDSPISDRMHENLLDLLVQIKPLCPNIRFLASHRYLDALGPRASRRDPGKEFDWSRFEKLGWEQLK
jgi:N-acetyl-anhydromuramyl-L-alanine amidase AmpD